MPEHTPRPWTGYITSRLQYSEISMWDDFHDWSSWLRWKAVECKAIVELLDDCDNTAAVKLYCIMCDLADGVRQMPEAARHG